MGKTQKIIFLSIFILLLIVLAFVFYKYNKLGKSTPSLSISPSASPSVLFVKSHISSVPFDRLPQYFPVDVFVEKDFKLIANSNTYFDDGKVWATRIYETKVDLPKLQKDYENYLGFLSGWKLEKPYMPDNNRVFLTAVKNGQVFNINISRGNSTNTVRLNLVVQNIK